MEQQTTSRKKFFLSGVLIAGGIALLKFSPFTKKKKETTKMLTEDGKLVEIDKALLASNKPKKISTAELQHWIKK